MTEETTVPTPQAITSWKNRGDKIVALAADLAAAQAKLEKKLKPIREAQEPEIERLKSELKKQEAEFTAFATEHYDSVFAEGSEIRTKVAVITGRLSPPSVYLESDDADVIAALESSKATKPFVAVKKSLDKAAIKKALNSGTEKLTAALTAAGVYLGQGVSVSVKSKGD